MQAIFTQYLAGDSYLKIAETMTKWGIPYHPHTPVWTKNMVKRILENEKYLRIKPYQTLSDAHLKEGFSRIDKWKNSEK